MTNDRFKFRVWDKVFNKYWTDEAIKENAAWLLFPDNDNIHNVEIEQCTGLKDKNGNLIFEGDVVRINGWWDACGPAGYNENKCVVEYDEGVAGFTPMCNYDCDCGVYHYACECEVIGNIHENEELLK